MAVYKCKMCGGNVDIQENSTIGVCQYCNTKQTFPTYTDSARSELYTQAGELRRQNRYDSASAAYRRLLGEDNNDAEAHWSLVLCKYGIEYVEDPVTRRRVPTVNRAQFTSIFDDEDYKAAIANADVLQRGVYQDEAREIDIIQKRILAISKAEKPFDIFICYKESDENGKRTRDSVYATQIYHLLSNEGYKVFFSRITLEDKLGVEYEPYIFAALHSSRVMIVVGTTPSYFDAVWVKNEWSRYLALIEQGEKKTLIPAFRDMDPSELPRELAYLQGLDMNQLGFSQDLLRGVKKILGGNSADTAFANDSNTSFNHNRASAVDNAAFGERAKKMLEAKDFFNLQSLCRNQLAADPTLALAYQYKLLARFRIVSLESLPDVTYPYETFQDYKKLYNYSDESMRQTLDALSAQHKQKLIPKIPLLADNARRLATILILWGCCALISVILSSLDFDYDYEKRRTLMKVMSVISSFFLGAFLAGIRYPMIRQSKKLMAYKPYRISATVSLFGGIAYFFIVLFLNVIIDLEIMELLGNIVGFSVLLVFMLDIIAGIWSLIEFNLFSADIRQEAGEGSLNLRSFFVEELKKGLSSAKGIFEEKRNDIAKKKNPKKKQ